MTAKDWISIALSSLALTISAITAFFNLTERDTLLALAEGLIVIEEDGTILKSKTIQFTFSNPGNRRIAVRGFGLAAQQVGEKEKLGRECPEVIYDQGDPVYGESVWFAFTPNTFRPIILGPGEIVTHREVFESRNEVAIEPLSGEKTARIFTCVTFHIVTERTLETVERLIGVASLTRTNSTVGTSSRPRPDFRQFMVLIDQTDFFLSALWSGPLQSFQTEEPYPGSGADAGAAEDEPKPFKIAKG